MKKFQTTEANIVKRLYGLSNRVRTMDLIYSTGMESSRTRLEQLKIGFFKRLAENNYTKMIIENITTKYRDEPNKVNKNSIITEQKKITGSDEYSINTMLIKGKDKLKNIKKNNDKIEKSESVKKIKLILEKNKKNMAEELRAALNAF